MKPRMTDVVLPPTFEQTASFTPGPWRFDGDWRRIPTIIGADGVLVASVCKDKSIDGWVVELAEREANASLIAAAPELLAALTECLPWVSGNAGHMSADKLNGIADSARAAIAKAKATSAKNLHLTGG